MNPLELSNTTNIPNIFNVLKNRELGKRNSDQAINGIREERIQENVTNDVFVSYELKVKEIIPSFFRDYQYFRNHHLIAFHKIIAGSRGSRYDIYDNRITLYDLVGRKILWNYDLKDTTPINDLILSPEGRVLVLTNPSGIESIAKGYLLFEGKIIGKILFEAPSFYLNTFKILNDKLFCLSMWDGQFFWVKKSNRAYIWEKKSEEQIDLVMKEISIGEFSKDKHPSISNRKFCVIAAGKKNSPISAKNSAISAKVFVIDFTTGKTSTFDLENCEDKNDEIEISSLAIKRNVLIAGIYYKKMKSENEPRIIEMNLVSGKINNKYSLSCKNGKIIALKASDDHIAYVVEDADNNNSMMLNVINRIDDSQRELLSIPKPKHFTLALQFSGRALNVCSSRDDKDDTQTLCCLDLSKPELPIFNRDYVFTFKSKMSFQDGKLVILDKTFFNIYVQDFEQLDEIENLNEENNHISLNKKPSWRIEPASRRSELTENL